MAINLAIPINDLSRWNEESRLRVLASIEKILKSGQFLNGPFSQMLQGELSTMLNRREVLLVSNGTDALTIALLACGIESGDFVATVGNAGGYATGAIFRVGAKPVLVDVDYHSGQMSIADLSIKLEQFQVKAVVLTHLYGLMADVEAVCRLVKQHNCLLIEDCAQSIGAKIGHQLAGTFGDVSTFSFYPTKNLGAAGDAGAISFADHERALLAQRIAQYGWGSRYFIEVSAGFNSRCDEIQAAVILEKLKHLNEINQKRRAIIQRFVDSLSVDRRMINRPDSSFVGHLAVLVTANRTSDICRLSESGVQTTIHYPLLDNQQPAWSHYFAGVRIAASERLVTEIVTIPCFPELTEGEIERICSALSDLV